MKILENLPFKQARNYKRGRIRPVQLIVLHDMEAPEKGNTAENVAAYFAGSNAPMASAHFCVDQNSVIQCVRLEDTAFHCKNANSNGIGIEHAGYAKQTKDEWLDDYGKAMLELSAKLVAELCTRYSIPARRARFAGVNNPQVLAPGICGHVDVPAHGSHYDPGKNFPMDYYLERVRFYISEPLAQADEVKLDAIQSRAVAPASPTSQPALEPSARGNQSLADGLTTQNVDAGAAATQVVVQPNALETVSSPFDEPIRIAKGKAGDLLNYLMSASGIGVVVAFVQANPYLSAFFFVVGAVTVYYVVHINHQKKMKEAEIASDPHRYNIKFVKESK